jgi:thymidine kinase
MDCGKSTLALQLDYTQSTHGRKGRVFTSQDRAGEGLITSRLGLSVQAIEVDEGFDFWHYVIGELTSGHRVDYIVCDEAQFYTRDHVDQLARIVDELQLDVYAFGILADFRTTLFPGSQRLVELADRVETLPLGPLCWCGAKGTHNARTVDGLMVTEGSQVVVGDTADGGEVRYEVLCRAHHRRRMTAFRAKATLSPDPLPFDLET